MKSPSPKIILFLVAAIFIVGLSFYFKKDTEILYQSISNSQKPTIWEEVDNDGDGLLDWEEILWGTDPRKANSNESGLSDYEFVKQKKESGELSSTQTRPQKSSSYSTKNYTERLGIDLFAEYTNLKNSGGLNEASINNSANQIVSNFSIFESKRYLRSDIKTIFPDQEIDRMANYADNLMRTRNRYQIIYLEDPIRSAGGTTFSAGDLPADKFLRAGKLYYDLAEEIMRMEVPEGLVGLHLTLANSYKESGLGLSQIGENLKSDPLRALLGLETHTRAQTEESNAVNNIILFLSSNNINASTVNQT